jgi:pimeloyl-ACP methyl ester carboxylesterase
MYPDRIRRLLVDGNVYSAAHYQGWNPVSLDDLAYSIYTFSRLCFEAGTAWCKLAEGMTSPDDVQARFDAVVAKLYENPCTVGGATVDDNAFLNQVHRSLYFPRQGDADGRNYTFLADSILQYENCASGNGSTVAGDFKKRAAAPYVNDVEIGIITAVDIAGRYPWSTYEEWKAATDQFHATHPYGAEGYASSNGLIGLAMDSFVPPESQFFPGFEHINTSAPILFINTVADPITPRSAAYQMSALFEGSAVILVNGPGHGFSSSPSDCANQYLAAYFADGTVPEAHTWCETSVEADYYFGGVDPTIQSI